jgi:phage host-nuclease inhibitor protein Gam
MAKKTKDVQESIPTLEIRSEVEANDFIKKISDLQKEKNQIKDDYDLRISELQSDLAFEIEPIEKEIKTLTLSLKKFSDSKRTEFFKDSKTWSLPCGDLVYRKNPDSVDVKNSKNLIDKILTKNELLDFAEKAKVKFSKVFLKMKLEVNKEAIHENPKKAKELTGIGLSEGIERFTIKPYESNLEIEAPLED